jgi:riboflavin kinase/FMN adenylyltransferase
LQKVFDLKIYTNINENIPKNCVATIGFFDGVHNGHKFILKKMQQKASEHGVEELLISLWPHPAIFFNRPIDLLTTYEEKIELFQKIGIKNVLILNFNQELAQMSQDVFTNEFLIKKLKISELIMGYNNSFGAKNDATDFTNLTVPVTKTEKTLINGHDVNSSSIRELLKKGNVKDSEELLGYSYYLTGKVISGYQIGRKLGFPTANLGEINDLKLIPANGVYIAEVKHKEEWLPAMLNIGVRPSFNGNLRSIEFHIPKFYENLYDKTITIRFRKRIRDEIKFPGINDLIVQLGKDREETISFFQ